MYKHILLSIIAIILPIPIFINCEGLTFDHASSKITIFNSEHLFKTNLVIYFPNDWAVDYYLPSVCLTNIYTFFYLFILNAINLLLTIFLKPGKWYITFKKFKSIFIEQVYSNDSANWYKFTMDGKFPRGKLNFCIDQSLSDDPFWYHLPVPGNVTTKRLVNDFLSYDQMDFTESVFINSNGFAIGTFETDDLFTWKLRVQKLGRGRENFCWWVILEDDEYEAEDLDYIGYTSDYSFYIVAGKSIDLVANLTGNLPFMKKNKLQ